MGLVKKLREIGRSFYEGFYYLGKGFYSIGRGMAGIPFDTEILSGEEAYQEDAKKLGEDWDAVGMDMERALEIVEKEVKESKIRLR